jgi:hypothetical protein
VEALQVHHKDVGVVPDGDLLPGGHQLLAAITPAHEIMKQTLTDGVSHFCCADCVLMTLYLM